MYYELHKEQLEKYPAFRRTLDDLLQSNVISVVDVPRRKVRIVFPYDLRTDQAAKSLDCIKSENYTAFVNKRQTLAHVMRFGHPSILVRIPQLNMKNKSNKEMARVLENILNIGL